MTGHSRTLVALAALSFSLTLAPVAASAEENASAKARAQAALREGNTLLDQGRAPDALAKFAEAYRLFPSPKLHYNLGQAHILIPGHEAQAYQSMSRFLDEATDANKDLRAAAESERHRLRPKVGLLAVSAEPGDADLLIDGVNVGKVSPGVPAVVGIGAHELWLKKGDAASSPTSVTIAGGESADLPLRLALPPAAAPPSVAPPPLPALPPPAAVAPTANLVAMETAAPSPGYWTWQHKVGVAMASLGVASLALGIIEHVRYFGKKDDFVKANCGTDPMYLSGRPDCQSLKSDFNAANTLWVVGYIGAAALGATGTFLLWPAAASPPATSDGAPASKLAGVTFNFREEF